MWGARAFGPPQAQGERAAPATPLAAPQHYHDVQSVDLALFGEGVGPLRRACIFPNTLTYGVTKVPKGWSEGFWHFWHLDTLGFRETHDHILNIRQGSE